MPTNILRKAARPAAGGPEATGDANRDVLITVGRVQLHARLAATATAERLWNALPLYSTAETWGESIHFEVPIESGRERGARMNGSVGEIYFWPTEHRLLLVFGPTPISRSGELRLPSPCNLLAETSDDVSALRGVQPGEKVAMTRVVARHARGGKS